MDNTQNNINIKQILQLTENLADVVHKSLTIRIEDINDIKNQMSAISINLDRIVRLIDGNGRESLIERLSNVELLTKTLNNQTKTHEEKFNKFNVWLITVLGGLVLSLIGTVCSLILIL